MAYNNMLEILQVDTRFLNEDASDWSNSNDYQAAMTNIEALNVINDCAERGVKLSSDFLSAPKFKEHYQDLLQVVLQDRQRQSSPCRRITTNDRRYSLYA